MIAKGKREIPQQVKTVGQYIEESKDLENFQLFGITPVTG